MNNNSNLIMNSGGAQGPVNLAQKYSFKISGLGAMCPPLVTPILRMVDWVDGVSATGKKCITETGQIIIHILFILYS